MLRVSSWTWTSRPITVSYSMFCAAGGGVKCCSDAWKALSSSIAAGIWSNNEAAARHCRIWHDDDLVYAFSLNPLPSRALVRLTPSICRHGRPELDHPVADIVGALLRCRHAVVDAAFRAFLETCRTILPQ